MFTTQGAPVGRHLFAGIALMLFALVAWIDAASAQSSVRPPDNAVNVVPGEAGGGGTSGTSSVRPPDSAVLPEGPTVGTVRPPEALPDLAPLAPGETRQSDFVEAMNPTKAQTSLATQGPNSTPTMWQLLRDGTAGTVSIPDKQAGVLIQDAGTTWQSLRAKDGPLQKYGAYGLIGMLALLVLFYLIRGRIRIDGGFSGITIQRFNNLERFGHWTLAVSFILLALTGLNLLYGKDYLMPLIGKEAFATISLGGKWVHNNVAWPFMLALALIFFFWVLHNFPSRHDIVWILKGGGLFAKGVHPPSRKFNAGQKLIFWSTIVLGGSLSASGLALLFPYEFAMFDKTFVFLNSIGVEQVLGFALPTGLTPIQEMQYAQVWHSIVALAMTVIIVAHIYIGSVGMEGAFDAMGSGQVDRQWATEHHGLWVAEEDAKTISQNRDLPGRQVPAE